MAISQWGNMIYEIMLRLAPASGDSEIRAWFNRVMESHADEVSGEAFSALARFVMELFRTISPNRGSLSALQPTGSRPYQFFSYVVTPHGATNLYPSHWQRPESFDPDRFKKPRPVIKSMKPSASRLALPNVLLTEQPSR